MFVTQEFAVFMPILSFTLSFRSFQLLILRNKAITHLLSNTIYILSVSQLFTIVSIVSTASSYGFRYFLTLYPISIIYYYFLKEEKIFYNGTRFY